MAAEISPNVIHPRMLGIDLRVSTPVATADFSHSRIIYHDLDGTCFDTFTPKNGTDVETAYEEAVELIFGANALCTYIEKGRLRNRAPLDVTSELYNLGHQASCSAIKSLVADEGEDVVSSARAAQALHIFISSGGTDSSAKLDAATEALVIAKKRILMPQIGQNWPLSEPGFEKYWTAITAKDVPQTPNWLARGASERFALSQQRWRRLHTAIVSSGHTSMIRAFFANADLSEPGLYVSDDELRQHPNPRTKPDPLALKLAEEAWVTAYGADNDAKGASRSRQVHIGDDPIKDGEMAATHGITFVHYQRKAYPWPEIQERITEAVINNVSFADVV